MLSNYTPHFEMPGMVRLIETCVKCKRPKPPSKERLCVVCQTILKDQIFLKAHSCAMAAVWLR